MDPPLESAFSCSDSGSRLTENKNYTVGAVDFHKSKIGPIARSEVRLAWNTIGHNGYKKIRNLHILILKMKTYFGEEIFLNSA